jgi:tetratricopeptide (TPR) repeat protein
VLGDACIRAAKFDDARNIYKKVLGQRPRSGWALYGIAASWEKQGSHDEAVKAYREFLEAWSHADQDLPQIKSARAYIAKR